MDGALFLDEFRPFRRGEIALARRLVEDPVFLAPRHADLLRYAIRFAQLSTIGPERDALVYPIGSFRLRLLQLLAPALPTDPERMRAEDLYELLPRIVRLVTDARGWLLSQGLASEKELDDEISHKRLVLVLGGAAGSGFVFTGALVALERLGLVPSYMVGCSIGSLLAVVRARRARFEVEEVYEDLRRVREIGVFSAPQTTVRFGLPAALRLDLRSSLGALFSHSDGTPVRLADLPIPVDALATGVGSGAFSGDREQFAHIVKLRDVDAVARLRAGAAARLAARLVSLAMSRRLLVPMLLGSKGETAGLAALDAAGFSAAIPGLLHYDLPREETRGRAALEREFEEHDLVGIVDGVLSSAIPASYAWEQVEAGRIGSRNAAIVALDAVTAAGGANALIAPVLRAITSTSHRDRAFWDLCIHFRRVPPILELFPSETRLRRATRQGELEFEPSARLLQTLLAPTPPWRELAPAAAQT